MATPQRAPTVDTFPSLYRNAGIVLIDHTPASELQQGYMSSILLAQLIANQRHKVDAPKEWQHTLLTAFAKLGWLVTASSNRHLTQKTPFTLDDLLASEPNLGKPPLQHCLQRLTTAQSNAVCAHCILPLENGDTAIRVGLGVIADNGLLDLTIVSFIASSPSRACLAARFESCSRNPLTVAIDHHVIMAPETSAPPIDRKVTDALRDHYSKEIERICPLN